MHVTGKQPAKVSLIPVKWMELQLKQLLHPSMSNRVYETCSRDNSLHLQIKLLPTHNVIAGNTGFPHGAWHMTLSSYRRTYIHHAPNTKDTCTSQILCQTFNRTAHKICPSINPILIRALDIISPFVISKCSYMLFCVHKGNLMHNLKLLFGTVKARQPWHIFYLFFSIIMQQGIFAINCVIYTTRTAFCEFYGIARSTYIPI